MKANEETLPNSRYITLKVKKAVLKRQHNTCANHPLYPAINLSDYECKLWKWFIRSSRSSI
jgi:hypothetical protein